MIRHGNMNYGKLWLRYSPSVEKLRYTVDGARFAPDLSRQSIAGSDLRLQATTILQDFCEPLKYICIDNRLLRAVFALRLSSGSDRLSCSYHRYVQLVDPES